MDKKKILLVDDDQGTLDLLELFLYKDYEIATALNGYEGLSRIEEEPPDLIMTDITMPEMDGIRFFNRIGRNERAKRIPIIAVTSFGRGDTRGSLVNMGFYAVISKPFQREDIVTAAAAALNNKPDIHKKGE